MMVYNIILLLSNYGRPENRGNVDERTKYYVAEDEGRDDSRVTITAE